jgi:hypothetical protein
MLSNFVLIGYSDNKRKYVAYYEFDVIKEQCRALARKRALVSAGVAVVPVPFLDVVVDASILTVLDSRN